MGEYPLHRCRVTLTFLSFHSKFCRPWPKQNQYKAHARCIPLRGPAKIDNLCRWISSDTRNKLCAAISQRKLDFGKNVLIVILLDSQHAGRGDSRWTSVSNNAYTFAAQIDVMSPPGRMPCGAAKFVYADQIFRKEWVCKCTHSREYDLSLNNRSMFCDLIFQFYNIALVCSIPFQTFHACAEVGMRLEIVFVPEAFPICSNLGLVDEVSAPVRVGLAG